MSAHRFFLESPLRAEVGDETQLPLSESDAHHAIRVARVVAGEKIVVVDPDHTAWSVEVTSAIAGIVTAEVVREMDHIVEPRVTLFFGVAKGHKPDLVIEKVVELGVEAIRPFTSERTIVKLSADKAHTRGERWRRVALSAAKQSQRTFTPAVSDPQSLSEMAEIIGEHDKVFVAWEEFTGHGVREALVEAKASDSVAIIIGAEGGLTAEEVDALVDLGAEVISLGDTILRSETAGIVATALVVHEMGGLGGRVRE